MSFTLDCDTDDILQTSLCVEDEITFTSVYKETLLWLSYDICFLIVIYWINVLNHLINIFKKRINKTEIHPYFKLFIAVI